MSLRDDPRVLRFVDAARKFRTLIENPELKGEGLVRALLPALAELYGAGLGLEDLQFEEPPDEALKAHDIPHEEWNAMYQQLRDRIGPDACYWQMFDPTEDESGDNLVAGDLGDDLADIYHDIVPALKALDTPDDLTCVSAVDSWRLKFSIHWGNHAVAALKTLHWLEMKAGWGGPLRES